MKYASVCAGIEAASVVEKTCTKCSTPHPLESFHRHRSGKNGRHSWCKACCNVYYRTNRKRNYSPEQKRQWHMRSRYGIDATTVDEMIKLQGEKCAICEAETALVVDHCHTTGNVRGMLCHACNIMLPALERKDWMDRASQYLHDHALR